LKENKIPAAIFFYAEGVKLNLHGSVIEDLLLELENRGTLILTCTTCLNFYNVSSELATGKNGGMPDLIRLTGSSEKVITL
jgi:sulfur relay (sulfurtransferase) complex TusBCD TusD component (DsrE family)